MNAPKTLNDDVDPIELSNIMLNNHNASGDGDLLDAAVQIMRQAITVDPLNVNFTLQLSLCVQMRFERFGAAEDNDEAIALLSHVSENIPISEYDSLFVLNNLGNALQSRFQHTANPEDLEASILTRRRALDLTPDGSTDKPGMLSNLAATLQFRFVLKGELEDLEASISIQRRALELTPDGHGDKASRLKNLAAILQTRFAHLDNLEDLEEAISTGRRAIDLTPDGHSSKPGMLNNICIALQRRFQRVGELEDIEAALSAGRRAVELSPEGHPDKPMRLSNLGIALLTRFESAGELEVLEDAISTGRQAVELTPDGHPDKAGRLFNLGNALQVRFERMGELGDLQEAVVAKGRAVEFTPAGHPDKVARLNGFGDALKTLFDRVGKLEIIEVAISVGRQAVDLTPDGHPDKPVRLNNLGNSLQSRFRHEGRIEDLEEAIALTSRAVELTPEGHPRKAMWLTNLALAHQNRFDCTGDLDDLDAAISTNQSVIELTPDGHPAKPHRLTVLGNSLLRRFKQIGTQSAFDEVHACFMDGATSLSGSPSARFASGRLCVKSLNENPDFANPTSLLEAHSHVLHILPELVWLGHSLDRRYEESSKLAEDVSEAVACAIEHGMLDRAVEWLETGRSVVWSQLLALRTPLDELEEQHPELSKSLRDTQEQLQQSAHILRSDRSYVPGSASGSSSNAALDRHRNLSIKYDRILSVIRECPGFEDLLRPKIFSALIPSAELVSGYFVYLNVHRTRCDALIITPSSAISLVPLPDLSKERASELRSQWTTRLDECAVRVRASIRAPSVRDDDTTRLAYLLESLWKWIVHPVLLSIEDIDDCTSTGLMSHLTWCPTGPLAQLPLHAAGVYSDPDGPRVFDFAVSSYSPSLSALLRSSQGLAKQPETSLRVLVVTQPATPGQSPLQGTVDEAHRLRQLLNDAQIQHELLDDEHATVAAVRSSMGRHPWVHLACHGSQHTGNAIQSAFHLYDGPLSLTDLMQTVSDDAELAFLSACQTATGDENNPEEAVHLAAGMLAVGFKGVVATMWSIGDAEAPIVVEAYYRELLERRIMGSVEKGETGAAYALHEAVKVLRDRVGEREILKWAPFVHFGM